MSRFSSIAVALGFALVAPLALAQDAWPSKPVRIVVPSAPGGGTDIYSRSIASAMTEVFKQQFFVENRPGGNAMLGAEIAAKSPPDGYTILISASPALVINPAMFSNMRYNPERDFAPIAPGVISPLIYVVHPGVPARTLAELVALGKRNPEKFTYGSAGQGSTTNLGVRLLEDATGARYTHIPYKGLGQAYQNLLSGDLSFMFSDVPTVLAHIRSGKLIALAVSEHTTLLPGTPTVTEAGFPASAVHASFMVSAPMGTPTAIINRLNSEINRHMRIPAVTERLESQGLVPRYATAEEFGVMLKKEREMWVAAVKRMGIKGEE